MRGHSLSKTGVNALLTRASMTSLRQGQAVLPCWRMSLVDCRVKPGNYSVERRCAAKHTAVIPRESGPAFAGTNGAKQNGRARRARPFPNSAMTCQSDRLALPFDDRVLRYRWFVLFVVVVV